MKAKIEDGKISIRLDELVDALSEDERKHVARMVMHDVSLFGAVLDLVRDGECFGDDVGPWWFDRGALLELRTKLMPLMADVARASLTEALRQRNEAKADADRHRAWAYKLYHAWPESLWRERPQGPAEWQPTYDPKGEEVDAFDARHALLPTDRREGT